VTYRIRVFSVLAAAVAAAAIALGADTTGTLAGSVADPSKAAISGAQIELINESTNVRTVQKSTEDGAFMFNLIPSGTYTVAASAEGFRKKLNTGVRVEVNRNARVDIALEVGEVAQSVEVTANVGAVDSVSAQVATNVEKRYLAELPSVSRNALSYAALAPGVQIQNVSVLPALTGVVGTSAVVNGNRVGANVFMLDGSDNSGAFQNAAFQFPSPESIEEVGTSTASTSAEFGKQPGGIFSVVTKSGTNEFHGSVYHYRNNAALDANEWARNKSGAVRPEDNKSDTGATFGGPIRRGRTFFFLSYDAYREKVPGFQNTVQFPTAATNRGDFSQFGKQLYDPNSGKPIPGNIIPANLLDPVAANLLKEIPTVANFGDRYVWAYQNPADNSQLLSKLDHTLTSKQSFQATYFHTWGGITLPQTGSNGNVPSWGPQVNRVYQDTLSARHTWVVTPKLLAQTRFALARHIADRQLPNQGRDLSAFGAIWPANQKGANVNLPSITVVDGLYASQGTISYFREHNYTGASTITYTTGRHNLRFGGEIKDDVFQMTKDQDSANFKFDGRASSSAAGVGQFGYALADFVMGRVASFNTSGVLDYDLRYNAQSLFLQDDWKLTPRLTLTPGIRYEIISPTTEHNGRASAFVYGHQSDLYPAAPLHLAFLGDKGIPSGFQSRDWNNIAPRLGVAYDLSGNGRTVVRGGFGTYYSANHFRAKMGAGGGIPWVGTATGGDTTSLVDPWGTSRTIVYKTPPTPFDSGPAKFAYPPRLTGIYAYSKDFPTPYVLQWNVSAEHEIARGVTILAGYVANRSLKLLQNVPDNLPVWTADASLRNVEDRRPISTYGQIQSVQPRARSWYDSFQLSSNARLTNRLSARFTYVFANARENSAEALWGDPRGGDAVGGATNPRNLDAEKAPSAARHNFRAFYVYELPRFASSGAFARQVLGGWQVSGLVSISSGDPVNVLLGQDWNYDGVATDRPDLTGSIRYSQGSKDERANNYFDTSVFAAPAVHNAFGNLGRNALWAPGTWNTDLSLAKTWQVWEQRSVQARADAFDALNHNNLDLPNTTANSKDFGRILTRTGSRTVRLGLKFSF
jgi:hypothetical protein